MKISFLTKFGSLFVAICLLLTLFACDSNSSQNETSATMATTLQESSAESTETEAPVDGPMSKYEQTITLKSVLQEEPAAVFAEGDDINNNPITRDIESTLGIKVEYDWTVPAEQYENKLNISIAAGDIPDFFACSSTVFSMLSETDQLADLTGVYEKYATPELKETFEAFPEGFESGMYNGKLTGLSQQGWGLISTIPVVWIRSDWLQKFNLSAPQSVEDLLKIAETFMTQDPDGDGENNTFGFGLTKDLSGAGLYDIYNFANAYHAYPGIWVKDSSGQIVYGSILPETREFLIAMQDLFKKGMFDKEFGAKDVDKVNSDLINEKIGIEFGQNWNGFWPFPDLVKKNPDAIFKPYAIPSVDGQPVKLAAGFPVGTYYVVSKNCKNPEAIIKMANLRNLKTYHSEKEEYDKYRDVWLVSPISILDPTSDYRKFKEITEALKSGDTSNLDTSQQANYDAVLKWRDNKDPDGLGQYFQLSEEGSYNVLKKFVDANNIVLSEIRGANPIVYAEKKATLDKLEKEVFTRIILGASIDEFDKFVADWKKLGGDESTIAINERFNN